MNAIVSSNSNKTAATAHPEVSKAKVETLKSKVTVPVESAEVLNKTPANKSNSSPAAVVSLGKNKPADQALYKKSGQLEQPVATANTKISKAKSESPDSESAGTFTAGKGDVVVDIKNSDSGYDNKIYWSTDNFKTKHYVGVDNNTGSVNIGKFAEGTKIEFGIDNGSGQFFRTGAAANNSDNLEHAKVTKTDAGTQIGFEDLQGGGDNDFNDAIIKVRNLPPTADAAPKVESKNPKIELPPKEEPKSKVETKTKVDAKEPEGKTIPIVKTKKDNRDLEVLPKAEPKTDSKITKIDSKADPKIDTKTTSTNRSGLGDGTNPGKGDGKVNATNTGTNNPNKASAYIPKPAVGGQLKVAV